MIQQILVNLSTSQDPQLYQQTVNSINAWMQNPFQPWAVAKFRPTAYMLKTVMAYLDNLIAWGDSLFQQYTIETINEATQIYILAANILGDKPQAVPQKGSVKPLTYNDLRGASSMPFGNAMVDMEVDIPFDIVAAVRTGHRHPTARRSCPASARRSTSASRATTSCSPTGTRWPTGCSRFTTASTCRACSSSFRFTIRRSIRRCWCGPPPPDWTSAPSSAASISRLPLVRFQLLVAKATEICQEVKSLGANLLAAIEKQDNESLSLLRAQHENAILRLAEMVKYSQWQDAKGDAGAAALAGQRRSALHLLSETAGPHRRADQQQPSATRCSGSGQPAESEFLAGRRHPASRRCRWTRSLRISRRIRPR